MGLHDLLQPGYAEDSNYGPETIGVPKRTMPWEIGRALLFITGMVLMNVTGVGAAIDTAAPNPSIDLPGGDAVLSELQSLDPTSKYVPDKHVPAPEANTSTTGQVLDTETTSSGTDADTGFSHTISSR
jgi:hypothetical protein